MAIFRGHEAPTIGPLPPDEKEPERIAPTPADQAEALRAEADRACGAQSWGLCILKLEAAKKLDPAGELTARVQGLRTAIAEHRTMTDPVDPKQ